MNFLLRNFLKGLLISVPIGFTIYLIYFAVTKIDALIQTSIPGLGLLVVLASVTAVGFLTSNVVGRRIFQATENMMRKVPVVRLLYNSLKDVVHALFGENKGQYRPVVVTLMPEQDIKVFGFVTREHLDIAGVEQHVAVYLPQSYNIAGNLLLVPRHRVQAISVDSSQLMAFLMSGGVARPTPDTTGKFSNSP